MFGLKKKQTARPVIAAPVDGRYVAIEDVADPLFSQKAMGEGFGIDPIAPTVYSPVTGTINSVFKTKHAIGITTDEGLEVLIHIGLDTVNLNGKPFDMLAGTGQRVEVGTPLVDVDTKQITAAGLDPVVLTLITNSAEKVVAVSFAGDSLKHGDAVGNVTVA